MCGLARRGGLGGGDRAGLDRGSKCWNAGRPGLVAQQAGHAFGPEPFLPPPDRGLARAGAAGEFHRAAALGCQQDDLPRQTCFCGLFRSVTMATRAWWSVSETATVLRLRIRQTR